MGSGHGPERRQKKFGSARLWLTGFMLCGINSHRVVASDHTLGGFKGKIARRDGESCPTLAEKRALLRREGVRFDATGTKVLGTAFRGFP
jgi:hypothetical protein